MFLPVIVTMIADKTIARLCWHAGLQELTAGQGPTIASTTWPEDRSPRDDFQTAVNDCLAALDSLNQELRGKDYLPRLVVYAVTEIVRMIRVCEERAHDERTAREFARAAWRIETAWSGVLAGDEEDLLAYVDLEERMRFE